MKRTIPLLLGLVGLGIWVLNRGEKAKAIVLPPEAPGAPPTYTSVHSVGMATWARFADLTIRSDWQIPTTWYGWLNRDQWYYITGEGQSQELIEIDGWESPIGVPVDSSEILGPAYAFNPWYVPGS